MSEDMRRLHRMDRADGVVNKIFVFINLFAIAASAVILLVTVANVIMRALFSSPINGAIELSTDMMVMVSYCSFPIVTLLSGHISVDLVARKLPRFVQTGLKVFNLVLYSALCCYAGYATLVKGAYEKVLGTSGSSLRIPYWIFYYIIGGMLFISVLCAFYNIVHIFVTGQELKEDALREYSQSRAQKGKEAGGS